MTQPVTPNRGGLVRTATTFGLIVTAVLLCALTLKAGFGNHHYSDFGVFWHAGKNVLNQADPYPAATFHALRHQDQFVYPAPAALLMAPFALLPVGVAAGMFLLLSIAAIVVSLWLVDLRDVRCYAISFLSLVTIQALVMGAITPFLMLALAVCWRYRERLGILAPTAALAVGIKLFLAPMALWLVASKRYRELLTAAVVGVLVIVTCWLLIGLDSLRAYPALLAELTKVEGHSGYSTYALVCVLGAPDAAAKLFVVAVVIGLGAAAIWRAKRPGGDACAFGISIVACLVASPIVWLHYYGVIIIALAVLRPRLSWAWLIPLTSWIYANPNLPAPLWKILAAHGVLLAVLWLAVRSSNPAHAVGALPAPTSAADSEQVAAA